jgi:hypothetical protein
MAVDPLSLGALSAVAITEGIKFLYGQAGEILKRWAARRDEHAKDTPIAVSAPDIIEGEIEPVVPNWETVQRLEEELHRLRGRLNPYYEGTKKTDPGNEDLISDVDALRRGLEAVLGQPITLKGEERAVDKLVVTGEAHIQDLTGEAVGLEAEGSSGRFAGEVHVGTAREGSKVVGTKFTRQRRS